MAAMEVETTPAPTPAPAVVSANGHSDAVQANDSAASGANGDAMSLTSTAAAASSSGGSSSSAGSSSTSGSGPVGRDDLAKREEHDRLLSFPVIWNDGKSDHMIELIALKNIFSMQLPKMPKEYIVRLVLDRNHRSMCIKKKDKVIGGICFRPFHSQGFAEIVFAAITSTEQVKGYGTRLMNHLKEHVKTERVEYFLTYADNYAIGYFKKQGFTKQITMPRERWGGFIKDYDGGTLMECKINFRVNYLDIAGMIAAQRACVAERIKKISNSHIVYAGLPIFNDPNVKLPIPIESIPGVLEAGYKPPVEPDASASGGAAGGAGAALSKPLFPSDGASKELQAKFGLILKQLKNAKDAWPFQEPVDPKLVPDYLEIIKTPMDLGTMTSKLNEGRYHTKDAFVADVKLIIVNAKRYNQPDTQYYRAAEKIENIFEKLIQQHFGGGDGAQTGAATGAGTAVTGAAPGTGGGVTAGGTNGSANADADSTSPGSSGAAQGNVAAAADGAQSNAMQLEEATTG